MCRSQADLQGVGLTGAKGREEKHVSVPTQQQTHTHTHTTWDKLMAWFEIIHLASKAMKTGLDDMNEKVNHSEHLISVCIYGWLNEVSFQFQKE